MLTLLHHFRYTCGPSWVHRLYTAFTRTVQCGHTQNMCLVTFLGLRLVQEDVIWNTPRAFFRLWYTMKPKTGLRVVAAISHNCRCNNSSTALSFCKPVNMHFLISLDYIRTSVLTQHSLHETDEGCGALRTFMTLSAWLPSPFWKSTACETRLLIFSTDEIGSVKFIPLRFIQISLCPSSSELNAE